MPKKAPSQATVLANSLAPLNRSTLALDIKKEHQCVEDKIKDLSKFLLVTKNVERLTVAEHKLLKKLLTEYKSVASVLKNILSLSEM